MKSRKCNQYRAATSLNGSETIIWRNYRGKQQQHGIA